MTGPRVVVVGAGVAGSGAALAAARTGAGVTVIDGGTGASTLWTGAVDPAGEVEGDVREVAARLGVLAAPSIIATTGGLIRSVGGREAAILDLSPPYGAPHLVGVVRCARPGWDADAIARSAGPGLFAIDAAILRHSDEHLVADADFAARHDDPERLAWLAARLREGLAQSQRPIHALLLPSSLGVDRSHAARLSEMLGIPAGEATAMPGGPAGLRFERARDRAFVGANVTVLVERAQSVETTDSGRFRVRLESGATIEADAVVLAAGGLIGGGLEYQPSEAMLAAALPPSARIGFRSTIATPARVGARGKPLDVPGSLFGVAPEAIAWPLSPDALMDHVGLLHDGSGAMGPGLYVAGELAADAPRTWLAALRDGVRVGTCAANDAFTALAAPMALGTAQPAALSSRAREPASQP